MQTNYFDALGLPHGGEGVSVTRVKKAMRDLSRELHPDTGHGNEAHFKLITQAYDALNNETKLIDETRHARSGFYTSVMLRWAKDYDMFTGKRDDLKDHQRPGRGLFDDAFWAAAEEDARQARRASEQQRAKSRKAEEDRQREAYQKAYGHKPGRCGNHTASGPCVRPEGHPHGCMSQKVSDRKRENARRKRQGY